MSSMLNNHFNICIRLMTFTFLLHRINALFPLKLYVENVLFEKKKTHLFYYNTIGRTIVKITGTQLQILDFIFQFLYHWFLIFGPIYHCILLNKTVICINVGTIKNSSKHSSEMMILSFKIPRNPKKLFWRAMYLRTKRSIGFTAFKSIISLTEVVFS